MPAELNQQYAHVAACYSSPQTQFRFLLLIFTVIIFLIIRILKLGLNNPKRPVPPQLSKLIIAVIKLVLWIQIIPILVNRVGIAVDSLVAVVTAIALTIGMSLRPNAENFVAGVALMLEKPVELGDLVTLGGATGKAITGKVTTLGLALTTVQESDGNTVMIPNMKIFQGPMVNFSTAGRARIDVDFELLPTVRISEARECMLEVLSHLELVLPEPPPAVILKDVTQTSLKVVARFWVEPSKVFSANFPVREALHEALAAKGALAFWRASVGGALAQLEAVGYPGLAEGGGKKDSSQSSASAGGGDPDGDIAQFSVVV